MYACLHVCMCTCMHVCMYACVHVYMYVCMYIYACRLVCLCACMHAYYTCLKRFLVVENFSNALRIGFISFNFSSLDKGC